MNRLRNAAGSILLEVLVAALLIGIVVVPLGTSLVGGLDRARMVQEELAGETGWQSDSGYGWGPRVLAAWWDPGSVLRVQTGGLGPTGRETGYLGLWADGWLAAEEPIATADPAGENGLPKLSVSLPRWTGPTREELVIRVRRSDGPWGPPWRLAIPDSDGRPPATGTIAPSPAGNEAESPAGSEAEVVVHRPGAGTSSLAVSWRLGAVRPAPVGLLFFLRPSLPGWSESTLDARSQWWKAEEGRRVDLYY